MIDTDTPVTSGRVTSRDGTPIGYLRTGRGPAVVILHGSMESARSHTLLARALAGDFTVYLPDRGLPPPNDAGTARSRQSSSRSPGKRRIGPGHICTVPALPGGRMPAGRRHGPARRLRSLP
jgi:pimeloyl-ACP methyl ester carboxylesterase